MREVQVKELILLESNEKIKKDDLEKILSDNLKKGDFIRGKGEDGIIFTGIYSYYRWSNDRLVVYFSCKDKPDAFVKCKRKVTHLSKIENSYL